MWSRVSLATLVLAVAASTALAIPAFPGAEGPGSDATGARGQSVFHVTNLNDSGPGSFRDALSQSNRIIVFDVGGTIRQPPGSGTTTWLKSSQSNLTIAGQTAPGEGITIYGQGSKLSGSNVILRNIKFRPGEESGSTNDSFSNYLQNSIIDHVSCSWADDELLSSTDLARNCTVQYSILSEGLNYGGHSYGGLIQAETSDALMSYHHNLYAHTASRMPRLGSEVGTGVILNWSNNVIYDWSGNAGYSANDVDTGNPLPSRTNFLGNYYIAGNSTGSTDKTFSGANTVTLIYQQGNKRDMNKNGVIDGTDPGWGLFSGTYTQVTTPFDVASAYVQSADEALDTVTAYAGAMWWDRDVVDARIANDVMAATGSIISYVNNAPKDPNTSYTSTGFPIFPTVSRPAGFDTDQDGMPNAWELTRGLDPNTDDHNGDYDADGYTNIEEYLNELAAFPAPKAIVWTGGTAGRYELIANWDIPYQPSVYDQAEINSGKATVAYIGQHGGTLTVGNTASANGELAVTAGSLALANRLILGNATSARGTATLTGGSLTAGGAIVLAEASASTGELKVGKDAYVQVGGLTVQEGDGRLGKVAVEIASDAHSLIRTSAGSNLGGRMDVQVLGGWRPKEGDKFAVIASTDPSGVHFTGNFSTFTSNITTGLPGSSAFGGAANGANYELTFQGYTAGDANGNHVVDGGDLSLFGATWMQPLTGWGNCDFDGDGFVDGSMVVDGGDLGLMSGNWMWSLPASTGPLELSIPEPAVGVLLALGAAGLVRRRRGRAG